MRFYLITAFFLVATPTGVLSAQSAPPSQPSSMQMPMGGMGNEPSGKVTAQVSGPLTISFGDQSAEWTPEKLAALPHTSVTVWNEHAKANQTYSGVPLIVLLTRLGVAEKPRGKDLSDYVVAAGSDGYKVVYSIGEVTPDVHDATVIVADSEGGKPLTASGPLQLVATGEKRPARWVRNLVAIQVHTVN